jgi:nitrogen-specific signal transduction histidine kinase/ActR/RegA family two-component response regulator
MAGRDDGAGSLELERRIRERTEALRCALEEMQRLRQEKDTLLSHVTHELRTPLNAILGYAQLLKAGDLSAKQSGYVDTVIRAGRQLGDLLGDLRDISSVESGHLRMAIERVALADAVREACRLLEPEAAARGVTVTVEAFAADVDEVAADRRRLTQVIVNLVSNAVKYNHQYGTVTVSVHPAPPDVCLDVADTGVGLAPEQLGRIFEPFERLGAERTGVEGTGLGLALSRQLIVAMGGSIEVDSRYGRGTTFRVRLPSATTRLGPREPRRIAPPRAVHGGAPVRRVLYVEDNRDNIRLMEEVLEGSAFQVQLIPANRGRIGIQLAHECRPDLILLDLRLPDMHGDEVLRCLKADEAAATIPVFIVTADATPATSERLLGEGARACVTKPYQIDGLLSLVDDVLAMRSG